MSERRENAPENLEKRQIIIEGIEKQLRLPQFEYAYKNAKFNTRDKVLRGLGVVVEKETGIIVEPELIGNIKEKTRAQEAMVKSTPSFGWIFLEISSFGYIKKVEPADIFPPDPYALVNILEAVRLYNERIPIKKPPLKDHDKILKNMGISTE